MVYGEEQEQQAKGLEFTALPQHTVVNFNPEGEHSICFSETEFSSSFEHFPCVWKVILKSPERRGMGLVRKEIFLVTLCKL